MLASFERNLKTYSLLEFVPEKKIPNALYIVEVHLALKLVHRHSTFETNLTGQESQLAGGKPVGYIQTQPRS